jgi:hypothetical protein
MSRGSLSISRPPRPQTARIDTRSRDGRKRNFLRKQSYILEGAKKYKAHVPRPHQLMNKAIMVLVCRSAALQLRGARGT